MNGQESASGQAGTAQPLSIPEPKARKSLLWFGVLGPPLAWVAQLFVDYYLSSLRCAPGFTWVRWVGTSGFTILIVVATVIAALIAIAAGLGAWTIWRKLNTSVAATAEGATGRVPFMALGGMLLSLYFLLLIIVSGVPDAMLGCAV
jgi:hypothetical protein